MGRLIKTLTQRVQWGDDEIGNEETMRWGNRQEGTSSCKRHYWWAWAHASGHKSQDQAQAGMNTPLGNNSISWTPLSLH